MSNADDHVSVSQKIILFLIFVHGARILLGIKPSKIINLNSKRFLVPLFTLSKNL